MTIDQIVHAVHAGFQTADIANAKLVHQADCQSICRVDQIGAIVKGEAQTGEMFGTGFDATSCPRVSFKHDDGKTRGLQTAGRIQSCNACTHDDDIGIDRLGAGFVVGALGHPGMMARNMDLGNRRTCDYRRSR